MNSDIDIDQRLALSNEAKRLLGDPLFNGVLSVLVKGYMQTLMNTKPGSEEGLVAHASINALEDIKKQLKSLENDGTVLRKRLQQSAAHSTTT